MIHLRFSGWWRLALIGLISTTACRSTRLTTAREPFDTFYDRFMTDSAFQVERTRFPLPGQKFTAETEDSTYRWTLTDWRMLSEPQLDPTYYQRDLTVSDTLVTDEISGKSTGFYFKMVYRPVRRKWHLVYMVDRDL